MYAAIVVVLVLGPGAVVLAVVVRAARHRRDLHTALAPTLYPWSPDFERYATMPAVANAEHTTRPTA